MRRRTAYGDAEAEPTTGDSFTALFTVEVGYSNGDFRHVRLLDDRGRPWAEGSVPWSALREVRDRPVQSDESPERHYHVALGGRDLRPTE